ncbi:MAG TPA: nucleotidyl transferase AbiEii/AbiGii toxin family protein [Kofleriaceae bacterium]
MIAHFGDKIVLKGGLALELRLERARTTKDIDLVVFGDGEPLLERLQAAGQLDLRDFFSFEVAPDGDITGDGVVYGGHHFRVHCRLGGKTYAHFPVDVVLGGVMLGAASRVVYPDDLSFVGIAPPIVRVLPVATHIAEKLHAYSIPRTTTNFRVRDLPDLALLATVGERLDRRTLRAALTLTFEARNTHSIPSMLPPPPASWEKEYADLATANDLPWKTLPEAFAAARVFIDPVLAEDGDAIWSREAWSWITAPSS